MRQYLTIKNMRTEDSASSSDYLEKKKQLQVPNVPDKSSSSRTTQLQYRTLLDLTEPGDPVSRFQVLLDPVSPSLETQRLTTCPMFIPPKIQTMPCLKKQKPILHNFLQSLQEH